ncbi:HAD family hydrolase [Georgenia sunbinii]|uniref:HAD family hydrolase n=1 Tax=Georgenia sunbinii TaxID=3117728 RepID=UPI002F262F60
MPTIPAAATIPPESAATPLPQAVLWDMDGTLVDTEPYWIGSEIALAEEHGGSWSHEQALRLVGHSITTSARILRDEAGVQGTDDEIATTLVGRVADRVRTDGPPWRPGARELLDALREAGVPCALVTMSYTELAAAVLDTLPAGTFAAVVTGDEVVQGKPHPEPYLTAAARLGVDITACVAIEDSPPGVASAEAAGAATIAVPLMIDIPAAPGRSLLRTLEGVTLDDLATIAAGTPLQRG